MNAAWAIVLGVLLLLPQGRTKCARWMVGVARSIAVVGAVGTNIPPPNHAGWGVLSVALLLTIAVWWCVRGSSPAVGLRRALNVYAVLAIVWGVTALSACYGLSLRGSARFDEPPPAVEGLSVEPLRLRASDGEELGAWWCSASPSPHAVIIVVHGHNGCRSDFIEYAQFYGARGFDVVLLTVRAHGDSTGARTTFGYSARLDVIAALEEVERRDLGLPVLLLGHSLGAAAHAYAMEAIGDRVSGAILECLYRDLPSATHHRTRRFLPPGVDWFAAETLIAAGDWVLGPAATTSPADALRPCRLPVLVLAGDGDTSAPPEEARDLAAAAPRGEVVVLESDRHSPLLGRNPNGYAYTVDDWLRRQGFEIH